MTTKQSNPILPEKVIPPLLGVYMILMAVATLYLIYCFWPDLSQGSQSEKQLLLLVILAGALGSYAHSATSLASYIGNQNFNPTWTWWYILRPIIGVAIALIVYFVLRAGFLSIGSDPGNINPYGIVAFAALSGMFSKNATDKLSEVFDTLFKTKIEDQRADKLSDRILASKTMLPKDKISFMTLNKDDRLDQIKVESLFQQFKDQRTRLPIVDEDGILVMLIHQGLLHRFIAEKNIEASRNSKSFQIENSTLQDFIDHPGIRELAINATGFISQKTTLQETKLKMKAIKNCQDIMVTENGLSTEPVLGWLTNSDISKLSN